MRGCGSGADSWAGRQWAYISGRHPEKYASQNTYLHAKSLASWIQKSKVLNEFIDHISSSCMFDDPRLVNTSAIHTLHAWGLAVQSYKSLDPQFRVLIFLEGTNFMLPTVQYDTGAEGTLSGREAPVDGGLPLWWLWSIQWPTDSN